MFGHGAGRQRRSRWAILSLLFAVAFAWSFAVMGDRTGGNWNILRVGLAVGLGLSVLRLLFTFVSSKRHAQEKKERRADETAGMDAEGQPLAEEPGTDRRPTYEEVFQVQLNIDDAGLAGTSEDEEWQAEVEERVAEVEAEGQSPVDEYTIEEPVPAAEQDLQTVEPDLDTAVDHDQAIEADAEPVQALEPEDDAQDALRRMREEFAARAKEAELRVKQREAELDEAGSAPKSTQ
jgi:hypothetical protein